MAKKRKGRRKKCPLCKKCPLLNQGKNCSNFTPNADLSGCYLTNSVLVGVDLSGVNLQGAKLTNVDFTDADLTGADLTGADYTCTNFSGANLLNVKINDDYLAPVDLFNCNDIT